MHDRAMVASITVAVASMLVGSTVAGFAIGEALIGNPLGLALGVGAGAWLASMTVTRIIRQRYARLAPTDEREDTVE